MEFHLTGTSAVFAFFLVLAVPVVVITAWVGRASRVAHRYQQLRDNVIIAEYDPPGGLSPAEIGYLFDSHFNKTELVATLLDLEQRGLVRILRDGAGLRLEKTQGAGESLKAHETYLLVMLGTSTNLTIFSLRTVFGFKKQVRRSLTKQHYLKPQDEIYGYYLQRIIVAYFFVSSPLLLLFFATGTSGFFAVVFIFIIISIVAFPFFLSLAIVSMLVYNQMVGNQNLWTAKLKELWPQLQGYRVFIERVELDELQFESEDLKLRSKNQTMPYAVALNLNTEWQKRF